MKLWFLPLGVLVILGVAAAGYVGFYSTRPVTAQAQAAPPTVRVERGEVSLGVTAPGRLVGMRETVPSFGATDKLLSLPVRAGQHVAAGAALALLDPAPLEERVVIAQAELELASAWLAKLRAGPTPADMAAAQATVQAAEQTLSRAQAELAATKLVAPYAGVVLEVNASEDETVAADASHRPDAGGSGSDCGRGRLSAGEGRATGRSLLRCHARSSSHQPRGAHRPPAQRCRRHAGLPGLHRIGQYPKQPVGAAARRQGGIHALVKKPADLDPPQIGGLSPLFQPDERYNQELIVRWSPAPDSSQEK